jgi:hypothetical protein
VLRDNITRPRYAEIPIVPLIPPHGSKEHIVDFELSWLGIKPSRTGTNVSAPVVELEFMG